MSGQHIALIAFGFVVFVAVVLVLAEWFVRYIVRSAPEMRKYKRRKRP